MKKIKLIAFSSLSFLALCLLVFGSCEKSEFVYGPTTYYKPCEKVSCFNGGYCIDGLCRCPIGFEGESCQTRSSDKFVGFYDAVDQCNTAPDYICNISADNSDATKLIITDLGVICPNYTLLAYIQSEKTSFEIPLQASCGNYYISGNGNMNGNLINVFIQARDTVLHTSTSCTISLNKK